ESNKEAMMYGATKATLLLQSELLNSGHVEAAIHLSKILSRYGNGLLAISSDISSSAQMGYERNRIFPSIGLVQSNTVDKKDGEKEVKKLSCGGK
ncbi:MAG: hypothetical protein JO131_02365, partial [Gammaproteobacteria bacterium]|nr:hypothetical protein [Gammaproteobacteria bacterium]